MSNKSYFRIKNSASQETSNSLEIEFYGDIVSDSSCKIQNEDTCPIEVKNILAEARGKDLNIYINSGGGDVLAGYAIGNALKNYRGKTRCFVDGIAASIAGYIAMCCDEIYMPENSYLMMHKPLSAIFGHADELNSRAELLNSMQKGIVAAFLQKAKDGITETQINEFMNANNGDGTWFTGKEAANYFNIKPLETLKAVACIGKIFEMYKNCPQIVNNQANRCQLEFLKLKHTNLL